MPKFGFAVKCLCLSVAILSLVAAVGCGAGGSGGFLNNTENFTNASLKGSYVYQLHGGDSFLSPYREVGVFTADGAGNITGGSDDASFNTSSTAAPVTGTYQIASDGTGSITMTGVIGTINLAVTMVSNSKVYLIEADNLNSTRLGINASGIAELQDSAAIANTPIGSFAFRIHDEISGISQVPASQIGAFTAPGSGVNGAMDQNAGGTFSSPNLTWTFNAPGALGRGTGTFLNASTNVTSNFFYDIVNSGKVALLMSDAGVVGSGVAEAQSGAIGNGLSGTYAFGSSGDDTSFGAFGTVATVGEFNASGGNIAGVEDTMVDGNLTSNATITNCYSANSSGRVAVMNISGNTCSSTVTQVFWMVNPNRAFFLDLNPNTNISGDGSADLQTGTFSQGSMKGQFALAMGGTDLTTQQLGLSPQLLTRVGVVQLDGTGNVSINELANASDPNVGSVNAPGILSGTYSVSSNGRITGGAANGGGGFDFVMYGVSGTQAYALQADPGVITSGTLERQP